jgi:hypothetical protein
MGRSFLSVKLAAAFGLLVAGAVMAQQQVLEQSHDRSVEVIERVSESDSCGRSVSKLVHTPRATVIGARAAGAVRS